MKSVNLRASKFLSLITFGFSLLSGNLPAAILENLTIHLLPEESLRTKQGGQGREKSKVFCNN